MGKRKNQGQPKKQNGLTGEASTSQHHTTQHNVTSQNTLKIDITPKFYKHMKKQYMHQVPRICRPFVNQYFDWLKKLDAGEVMDWMEGGETVKEIYSKRAFPERIGIAGVRGLLRAAPRLKRRAAEAMNIEIACYTLRFENPIVWEVVQAYGELGMTKLEQALQDFKEILKLTEEA